MRYWRRHSTGSRSCCPTRRRCEPLREQARPLRAVRRSLAFICGSTAKSHLGTCGAAGANHSVDVPEVEDTGDASRFSAERQLSRTGGELRRRRWSTSRAATSSSWPCRELAEFFPAVREAKLIKATVIKEVHATFSPAPGSDAFRPSHTSPWPRLFLAGDWTATGWPSTMEGAVRSGYGAAEALSGRKFLVTRPAGERIDAAVWMTYGRFHQLHQLVLQLICL